MGGTMESLSDCKCQACDSSRVIEMQMGLIAKLSARVRQLERVLYRVGEA